MTAWPLHIVLYQPEIPQNTGNIGRTCVAVGAKLWLVQPLGFQLDDRRLQRAGLDHWKHLDYQIVADWPTLLRELGGDTRCWLFTKRAPATVWEAEFAHGDALVFGSESRGLPNRLLDESEARPVRIPQHPAVRSLNLASAVAAGAYEAARQIRWISRQG